MKGCGYSKVMLVTPDRPAEGSTTQWQLAMNDPDAPGKVKTHHILLVIRHPVGGIRTFCRYVYNRFDTKRFRFTLLAPECHETGILLTDLDSLGVRYIPLPERLSEKDFFVAATRIIRTGQFDLVHSHGFTSGVASAVGSLMMRTPHLLTCHDVLTDNQFAGLKGLFKRFAVGLALTTVDRIHCVTNDARDNLLDHLGILRLFRHRIRAIRNGIDSQLFLAAEPRDLREELCVDDRTFLIGFLGRFMSQKGFRYLVDALIEIRKRSDLPRKAVILTFGGQDGYYREERAEIERRGLSDSVLFLPFVPDVASTLKGLDVVAMPSLWEACGLLAMEAMAAGVPVIGSNCVGLREVLLDTPARVVPAMDATALANSLIAEMTSPTTAQARDFAPVAASRFSVETQAKDLKQLMFELVE